ncbi:hypothetical protein THER_1792 [Thermodesulfovibrio sp. N1]|nr:hypothetical protein [Thermodesulfovibrio sp. N1]ODA43480.1 hypothetical protein THER_1792 [Thermodesulfovibrio sp. N1]
MNQYDLWESINDELKNEEILRHFVPQNDIKREQNDKKRVNQNDKTLLGSTEERVKMTDKPVHGIYVVYGIKENPQIEVLNAFEKCIPESFTVYIKEVKIRDYTIFKCYNFKGMKLPRPESY